MQFFVIKQNLIIKETVKHVSFTTKCNHHNATCLNHEGELGGRRSTTGAKHLDLVTTWYSTSIHTHHI